MVYEKSILALDQRIMLAVQASIANGDLQVIGSSGDDAIWILAERDMTRANTPRVVRVFDVQLDYLSSFSSSKAPLITVSLNALTSIHVSGGNGKDQISFVNNSLLIPGRISTTVAGGSGDDDIVNSETLAGNTLFDGGEGNDRLDAASTILGGEGDDDITSSGDQPHLMDGGPGNDFIDDLGDKSTLIGGDGNDRIDARGFDRRYLKKVLPYTSIQTGDGNDTVRLDDGLDTVYTIHLGAGNDQCTSFFFDDKLGDDKPGHLNQVPAIYGDEGRDVIDMSNVWDPVFIDGGGGADRLTGNIGQHGGSRILGRGGNDVIHGGNDADFIKAGSGDDYIDGGSGTNVIYGEAGNDVFELSSGEETIFGGLGDDKIIATSYTGSQGRDVIFGNEGADLIRSRNHDQDTIFSDASDSIVADKYDVIR